MASSLTWPDADGGKMTSVRSQILYVTGHTWNKDEPQANQAIVVYQAQAQRNWHHELATRGVSFNISVIHEEQLMAATMYVLN
jgi:hypothetical protein